MNNYNETPSITVYSPDRRLSLGAVSYPINFTEDIRFNAASEVQFSVPEYFYDSEKYKWVKNPIYDKLVEDNLLFINDNRSYFSFPKISCHEKDITYSISETLKPRGVDSTYTPECSGFTIQPETQLFDIGTEQGYSYNNRAYLGTANGNNRGVYCQSSQNDRLYRLIACDTYIPVNKGDVVYLKSTSKGGSWDFSYHICYYNKEDSTDCTHEFPKGYINDYIPYPLTKLDTEDNYTYEKGKIYKYTKINDTTRDYHPYEYSSVQENREDRDIHPPYERLFPDIRIPIKNQLGGAESGFMRVSAYVAGNNASQRQITDEDGTRTDYNWMIPVFGYVKVYSGERRCSKVSTKLLSGRHEPKLQWFTISEVEETGYGTYKTKTIKAYTYEYTLSKRTFSIQESTLPLYVPPVIKNIVCGNNWIVDKTYSEVKTCPQIMKTGLLNQILEYLPNWKLGYISSKLLTRFRTISDTDNANIYSFLMNDIQSLYQCYFVFDGNEKTISVYTKEDIGVHQAANIHFTWDNVIKEINVNNSDTNYVTALRVHTAEDTYSLGLINPTGNNIIYDFTYPKSHKWFDFIADNEKNRTLKEAVEEWESKYKSNIDTYQEYGRTLISLTLNEIQLSSKLELALADYRAKADEINILIENDYKDSESEVPLSYIIGDKPRTPDDLTGTFKPKSKYQNYHSKSLYNELLSLSKNYYDIKSSVSSIRQELKTCEGNMRGISASLTLNCNGNNENTSVLTLAERQALDFYIKEGDWNHENIVFSETYSEDDIYNTLIDVYGDAKHDLENRLNQPIFEFTFDMANPLAMSEMEQQMSRLKLGRSCEIEVSPGQWVSPTLLEIHIEYSDATNTTFTFSTDYKRKPLQNRFADLFGTINQVSVKESVFTFTE